MSDKPYRYDICHGWGDRIEWTDFDQRALSGHQRRIPKVGDYLFAKMESGKVAVFCWDKVEPCGNPPDMFFGTVDDVGYEGGIDLPEFEEATSSHFPVFR